jgi:hypothetical protein
MEKAQKDKIVLTQSTQKSVENNIEALSDN